MLGKILLLFAATTAITYAQSNSFGNLLPNVSLPPALQGNLNSTELDTAKNKTLEEMKKRCEQNGGPDAFAKAQNASTELYQCFNSLVNVTVIQEEIKSAKPNGNVDEVFKKYCQKKPQFEACAKDFTDSSKACFSKEEQVHLNTVYNVSLQLADFVCYKDGDRLALFIAEGGLECFQDKQDGLRECFNKTVDLNKTADLQDQLDINSLSNFTLTFDEKQCKQIQELESCVVEVLATCPTPTTSNIMESIFKFVRTSTHCKEFVKDEESEARSRKSEPPKKDGATTFFVTSTTLIAAFLATVLV